MSIWIVIFLSLFWKRCDIKHCLAMKDAMTENSGELCMLRRKYIKLGDPKTPTKSVAILWTIKSNARSPLGPVTNVQWSMQSIAQSISDFYPDDYLNWFHLSSRHLQNRRPHRRRTLLLRIPKWSGLLHRRGQQGMCHKGEAGYHILFRKQPYPSVLSSFTIL